MSIIFRIVTWCVVQKDNTTYVRQSAGQTAYQSLDDPLERTYAARDEKPALFFWRSHDGLGVDLLIQTKGRLWPVEIKLTATPTTQHLKPMNRFLDLAGAEAASHGLLVCSVPQPRPLPGGHLALPWHHFPQWLQELTAG